MPARIPEDPRRSWNGGKTARSAFRIPRLQSRFLSLSELVCFFSSSTKGKIKRIRLFRNSSCARQREPCRFDVRYSADYSSRAGIPSTLVPKRVHSLGFRRGTAKIARAPVGGTIREYLWPDCWYSDGGSWPIRGRTADSRWWRPDAPARCISSVFGHIHYLQFPSTICEGWIAEEGGRVGRWEGGGSARARLTIWRLGEEGEGGGGAIWSIRAIWSGRLPRKTREILRTHSNNNCIQRTGGRIEGYRRASFVASLIARRIFYPIQCFFWN